MGPCRRARDEVGATLIEFVLVLPVLLLLVFGVIDWSLVRSQQHSVTNGVREGARRAVVAEWGNDTGCGAPGAAGTARTICMTKAEIGESDVSVYVKLEDKYLVGDYLTVCAQRPTTPVFGVTQRFIGGKVLHGEVTMRIEELGNGGMDTAGDAGDWSWCG